MSQAVFARVWLLLAALALLLCHAIASAQERHRTFRVPFHTVNSLILLDGQLNGKSAALLLDTGANNSVVDIHSAGFDGLKLDALRSTGAAGSVGAYVVREVKLSLEHRSWLNRRVCVMDLSDVSRRMRVRVDGFIGADVLSEFSAVRNRTTRRSPNQNPWS